MIQVEETSRRTVRYLFTSRPPHEGGGGGRRETPGPLRGAGSLTWPSRRGLKSLCGCASSRANSISSSSLLLATLLCCCCCLEGERPKEGRDVLSLFSCSSSPEIRIIINHTNKHPNEFKPKLCGSDRSAGSTYWRGEVLQRQRGDCCSL